MGLQSEPNHGWTTEGQVPQLLWARTEATAVSSPNLDRLLACHVALSGSDRDNLERYLLSNLRRDGPFSEVAYFIFLALFRFGRVIDAITTARTFLAGDKVYAYSNMLGTLSALVSHGHFSIDPQLYPAIVEALGGDNEFRLTEKLNLARLEYIDQNRAGSQGDPAAD